MHIPFKPELISCLFLLGPKPPLSNNKYTPSENPIEPPKTEPIIEPQKNSLFDHQVFFKEMETNFKVGKILISDMFKDPKKLELEKANEKPLARRMTSEIVAEVIDTIKAKTGIQQKHNTTHTHHIDPKLKQKLNDESVVRKMTREMVSEAISTVKEKVGINPKSITSAVATMAFAKAAMTGAVIATRTGNFIPFAGALMGTYISSQATKFFAKNGNKKGHVEKLEAEKNNNEQHHR